MANVTMIGALWKKQSQNPNAPVAQGNIEIDGKKIDIVIWKNGFKTKDNQPDLRISLDSPRNYGSDSGNARATPPASKGGDFHAPSATRIEPKEPNPFEKAAQEFEDEIPF
jgi:hypothetical protein